MGNNLEQEWEKIPRAIYVSPWDVDKFNKLNLCNKLQSLERIMRLFDIKNIGNYFIFNITSIKTKSSLEITIYFTFSLLSETVFKKTCEITNNMPAYVQIHHSEIEDKTQKLAGGVERLFVKLICNNSGRKQAEIYHKAVDGSLKVKTV